MERFVLDAYAILAQLKDEAGASQVTEILEKDTFIKVLWLPRKE